jgi:putative transcriptional regulator
MNSLKGQFLVAAQRQLDPNFAKTVILVCAHTEKTAFGVVVSRLRDGSDPSRQRSGTWCRPGKATLYRGGPVTGPLMAVHTRARFGEWQILPGVFFSRKENNVLALMRRSERLCRIFTGYVGWGQGQLDDEVQQGTWRVVPATPEQVFQADSDLWQQLSVLASRMQLRSMLRIRYFPLDPLLN